MVWDQILDSQCPPLVIAEFADSHFGSLSKAKELATAARASGADIAKFQHHIVHEEMLRDIPLSSNMREPLWDFLTRNALSIDQHVELASHCKDVGIDYLCTPFSVKAALELQDRVNPNMYKIGSGEMLDLPSISEIAKLGKPLIISTGMSSMAEVMETYAHVVNLGSPFVLMNCTSGYPPHPSEANLGFISQAKKLFPAAIIGHSDHFPDIDIALAAVALGARVIEKHVSDFDGTLGPDTSSSISFSSLAELVQSSKRIHSSLASEKRVHKSEEEIRAWAHRSLVYLEDLPAGASLESHHFWSKRPGTGIPARKRESFIGRVLTRPVKADTLISEEDFV